MEKHEILIVDDDKTTLKMLESVLSRAGYLIIPLSRGKEAIKIAKERQPDLIILDIMMPDIDGGSVASILKRDPETRNIPIFFLSSLITEKEERCSSRKHGICLISKPFQRDKLLERIREYIKEFDYYSVED